MDPFLSCCCQRFPEPKSVYSHNNKAPGSNTWKAKLMPADSRVPYNPEKESSLENSIVIERLLLYVLDGKLGMLPLERYLGCAAFRFTSLWLNRTGFTNTTCLCRM